MRAQYTLFQQGFNILDEIDPYMKKLAAQVKTKKNTQHTRTCVCVCVCCSDSVVHCFSQLDQLVIDSAMEKREMEHKHALIQQRVRQQHKNYNTT